MPNRFLFLTLRVFSATGGIEKVCKVFGKAIYEFQEQQEDKEEVHVMSMYDRDTDIDERYFPSSNFKGYNQHKLRFVYSAIRKGLKCQNVVLSHINLLLIGYLIKILRPKTKLFLFAHGIEVWGPLSTKRKRMLNACNCIIAVSNFTKQKMMREFGIAEEKITVLNNCLDPFLPPPLKGGKNSELMHKYGFSATDTVLMTLTRISNKERYKGYDHVISAIGELKKKYNGLKYLVVGRYDEPERHRLAFLIQQNELEGNVIFTGYIRDEELANHYSLADIYVMPSKKEGFGIVFIEAMHFGLPVIAGNKDGSADALFHGELGLLIDPDNQSQLIQAIEKLIQHKNLFLPQKKILDREFSYSTYQFKIKKLFDNYLQSHND